MNYRVLRLISNTENLQHTQRSLIKTYSEVYIVSYVKDPAQKTRIHQIPAIKKVLSAYF